MERRAFLLFSVSAAIVGFKSRSRIQSFARRLLNWLEYDGLEGIVSYSSRVIAAARALEHEREDRLFEDPLAAALAGRKALDEARARRKGSGGEESGQRKLGRIVVRTKFFDDAIMTAVGKLQHEQYIPMVQPDSPPCVQVVLLGSGMDSRPWRLALPSGVAWFEVDQRDVLRAKAGALRRQGAQLEADGVRGHRHPLRAASWSCVAADLQQPGWTQTLQRAGFDPRQPTCWVAEGLLYYLQPSTVPSLLREAAAASAPGSVLMASIITEESLQWLHQRSAAAASGEAGSGAEAGQQKAAGSGRTAGQSLTSKFIWGCPGEVGQFFSGCGWQPAVHNVWMATAAAYGWQCASAEATNDMSALPDRLRPQDLACLLAA